MKISFELSEDQIAIQSMARSFAQEQLAPHALEWDREKFFPIDTLRAAAALGLAGIYVDGSHGGSGLSRLDAVLIIEALAMGCPSVAAYVSIHNMVAGMIDRYGDDTQRAKFLPELCSMSRLAAYCLTEPSSGSDAASLRTSAVRSGDHYIVNGVKQFISAAGAAHIYAVMVRTGGPGPKGISTLLIEKDMPGVSFGVNEQKMGWNAQPTRQVILEDVRVPAENRLGPEGIGFNVAMAGLNGGRINIAAAALGGAQTAFEKSMDYVSSRKAFGQSLSQFQALQFRLADMGTSLEVSRTFLWRAAAALDTQAADAAKLCAMAKRFVTDASFEVANQALQLHGGYGYLADYGVEKIVRDLRVNQILEGTNEIMRVIIARALMGEI